MRVRVQVFQGDLGFQRGDHATRSFEENVIFVRDATMVHVVVEAVVKLLLDLHLRHWYKSVFFVGTDDSVLYIHHPNVPKKTNNASEHETDVHVQGQDVADTL